MNLHNMEVGMTRNLAIVCPSGLICIFTLQWIPEPHFKHLGQYIFGPPQNPIPLTEGFVLDP